VRVAELAVELGRHGVGLEPHPLLSVREERRFSAASSSGRVVIAERARRKRRALLATRPPSPTVIVHRQADLFPTLALERTIAARRRLFYDIDDAVWLNPFGRGRWLVAPRKIRWLAEHAECVLAGNDHLAERLSRYARRVVVVPSVVDPRLMARRRHAGADALVVGWIGSPDNAAYLSHLLPVLSQVARTLSPQRLVLDLIGGEVHAPRGVQIRAAPWSLVAERAALARIDVGLMPLPDNAWTRGKCGYKALLYQAAGIPVVADDVGVARQVVTDGGFVVRGASEWADALQALLTDERLRERMGVAGRHHVEQHYSVATWGPRVARVLAGS
jgi:glycosyltransferase involved in cell wall biosynthesis